MEGKLDKIIGIIKDLTDDNTLVIIGTLIIAWISPEHRELVIGGLLGWIAHTPDK